MFVYWSHGEVDLLPSVNTLELAHNKPQHKRWNFTGLFTLLYLSIETSSVQISGTLKIIYVGCQFF